MFNCRAGGVLPRFSTNKKEAEMIKNFLGYSVVGKDKIRTCQSKIVPCQRTLIDLLKIDFSSAA